MIGASLIGSSGIPNWGGGSNDCMSRPSSGIFQLCPTTLAPRPLPWGSPEFIGLGFLSFVSIILTELFGSPFLKNISIIVGLAVGCIVAGAAGYIDGSSIKTAPAITFLWYELILYSPTLVLDLGCLGYTPSRFVYTHPPSSPCWRFTVCHTCQECLTFILTEFLVSLAMEAIGDITASAEVSRVPVVGEEFDSRIQGGVLVGLTSFRIPNVSNLLVRATALAGSSQPCSP